MIFLLLFSCFFPPTARHVIVADGSVGLGPSIIGLHIAWSEPAEDFPSWICIWAESVDLTWTWFSISSLLNMCSLIMTMCVRPVPVGSPSCGGDVMVYVWHKPAKLAHSFLFDSCVYFCLYGPFNCISFHKFPRQLSVLYLFSFGLSSALLVLSTIHLFMKFSFSPGIIPSGWLGSKHQLTNELYKWVRPDAVLCDWHDVKIQSQLPPDTAHQFGETNDKRSTRVSCSWSCHIQLPFKQT